MSRRFEGLRQYHHAIRHLARTRIASKKLLWASAATALALSSGATATYISQSKSNPDTPAHQNDANKTADAPHPLLGLQDTPDAAPQDHMSPAPQSESRQNTSTDSTGTQGTNETTVTINGESIEVPPNGSSHQTIRNSDGTQTEVDVRHEQTQVDGTPKSNITIDSRSRSSNSSSTSINSRITITH